MIDFKFPYRGDAYRVLVTDGEEITSWTQIVKAHTTPLGSLACHGTRSAGFASSQLHSHVLSKRLKFNAEIDITGFGRERHYQTEN